VAAPALIGACFGDPDDPATLSGVPKHLFDALERRYGRVARVDYRLSPLQRALVAARSVRLSRTKWQERYHINALSYRLRSENLRRRLAGVDVSGRAAVVVQVFGVVEPPGRPYVVYLDQTWLMASAGWAPWLPSQTGEREEWVERERRMLQRARHVFTMAGPAAESLRTSYGLSDDRVTVVGGGVNFETLPTLTGSERKEPVVLFVGRDPARKGMDVLVSAFRLVKERVPAVRLQVIGTDDVPHEPGVEVLGRVAERSRVEDAYRSSAVFCLPSRYEPYGLALLEAMAYGVPCVGTTVGGIPEIIVEGETGRLVEPDDPEALAQALVSLLESPVQASAFGAAGRARVERELNWDAVAARMAPALEA
jgi:glycosyltransferase involved in cell wall biosynthesis